MSILENLKELESYLDGEIRAFNDQAVIAEGRGMSKAGLYCRAVSDSYQNVLGRLRGLVPDSLVSQVVADSPGPAKTP